jgi:undecaprenyl-diphosphatase
VRIATVLSGMFTDRKAQRLVINLIAFLPAAILGFLFSRRIKEVLFNPVSVAIAFIVGGLIILWVERRNKDRMSMASARVETVDDMTPLDALKVGIAQAFALIPGTSRSGATIIGGMMFGLSRKAATEFSFFLAIPTLFAATIYSLYKERALLSAADAAVQSAPWPPSSRPSCACAGCCATSARTISPFAWYRIVFGIIVLVTAYTGAAWVSGLGRVSVRPCQPAPCGRGTLQHPSGLAAGGVHNSLSPPPSEHTPWPTSAAPGLISALPP